MGSAPEIHARAAVLIAHDHTTIGLVARRKQGERAVFSSRYAPLLRKGGVDVLGLVVGSDRPLWPDPREEELMKRESPCWWGSLALIDTAWQEAEESADSLTICLTSADIDRALAEGKIAVVLIMEGSRAITEGPSAESLLNLRTLYRLGVRSVQIVGGLWNAFVDAPEGAERSNGLSELGVAVVRETNRLGILIDVAHIPPADPLFEHIVETSQQPIIDSHGNAIGVNELEWNNLTDERIKAIAGTGGVMGIKFRHCGPKPGAELTTVSDVVDHIEYIAGLVGVDYVGLGSDQLDRTLPGLGDLSPEPEGLEDLTKVPNITAEMVRRGYPEEDMRKILGGNFLRVYQQVIG